MLEGGTRSAVCLSSDLPTHVEPVNDSKWPPGVGEDGR